MNCEEAFEDRPKVLEGQGIGSIRLGFFWIVVDLKKNTIHAGSDCSARQDRNEFRLAAGNSIGSRGRLHRMCSIEDNWSKPAHDGKGAHVHNKIVVSKAGASFRQKYAGVSGSG